MKMNKLISVLSAGALVVGFVACESAEQSFPDSDSGTTAYFAYQYPIRTLILGNVETYDNTSDNEGRFTIYGTFGGSYSGINAKIDVAVDETLTQGLTFEDGTPVKPMPKDYYEISGTQLDYAGGYRGGVEVKLNQKFFDDTLSVSNNYVIPVVMGDFTGVDKVYRGTPIVEGSSPLRQDPSKWDPTPKDFTLFCVNYINKYTATFLRRGVDNYDALKFKDVEKEIDDMCIVVHSDDKQDQVWDSQFWIDAVNEFKEGDAWTLTMDIKATKDAVSTTQVHKAAGEYLHYVGVGDINFTTEWTKFEASGKFDASQATGHSIALNLNDFAEGNDYYFDNISFVVAGVEQISNVACDEKDSENFWSKEKRGATLKSSFEPTGKKQKITVSEPDGYEKRTGVRHGQFIEKDEVVYTTSKSKNQIIVPIATTEVSGVITPCELILTFDESGNCTIASNTPGVKAEGTGKYIENSEKLAWGNKDRDGLYLDYNLVFDQDDIHYATKDTLVWRDRGAAAAIQTFSPKFVGE